MTLKNERTFKIGIIGAGIVGLSVATIIKDRLEDAVKLEITAAERDEDTTSWGSAGYCWMNTKGLPETPLPQHQRWNKASLEHFLQLYRSGEATSAGILVTPLYIVSTKPLKSSIDEGFCDHYINIRHAYEKELASLGFPNDTRYGICVTSTMTESRYYLPYLEECLTRNGVTFRQEQLNGGTSNVADWAVSRNYDLVVNCSGLGARELFQDDKISALRGQVARVQAPWFKHCFMSTDDTYAFSCRDSVVVGGFRQLDDWDKGVRASETLNILARVRRHNRCLADSPILEEWAGLRPWRPSVRVETDHIMSSEGRKMPVVHNYGHGSSGIGLSWGTSLEAADLVQSVLQHRLARL